jgi:hypothetical protein
VDGVGGAVNELSESIMLIFVAGSVLIFLIVLGVGFFLAAS